MSMVELKIVQKEEWEKFDTSVLEEVIASMPRKSVSFARLDYTFKLGRAATKPDNVNKHMTPLAMATYHYT
ncbi:hypothetical protein G9A89_014014 [Geosiphon pyriformis]|nr:hypothetical protein G9A89_014014 [Geosiphon pyriformis]